MKTIFSLLFIFSLIVLSGCNQTASTEQQKTTATSNKTASGNLILETVSPPVFEAKIKHYTDEQLVDIRTLEELEETGILAGAQHLDYFRKDFNTEIIKFDKERPIMIYCKSGGRSSRVVDILNLRGYKAVYELKGGITDWMKNGKPVEKYVAD